MALDFVVTDGTSDIYHKHVPIHRDAYTSLRFYCATKDEYPFLYRISDYYDDAIFESHELPCFIRELLKWRDGVDDIHIDYMNQIITISVYALRNGYQVEAVAD